MPEEQGRDGRKAEPGVTREMAAEAAVWIARLHGPERSKLMERECLAWQALSPAHRLAFERCTDLWMDVAGVDRAAVVRASDAAVPEDLLGRRLRLGPRTLVASLTAVVVLAAALLAQPWLQGDTYDTGIGEQRLVVLQDGTRMSLNTSTRVKVELGQTQRRVSVEGGEAFFEVAKDAGRPFVVRAAGAEVTATGTAFVVRVAPGVDAGRKTLAVTLVEGRVVVRGADDSVTAQHAGPPLQMSPGERLRVPGSARSGAGGAARVDRPRMDQVLAWKRGEAIFDNTALLDALAEMNRYSAVPVVVADPQALGGLRVSGLFKTGDNAGFAHALAALHGLAVREGPGQLELVPR